MSCAIEGVTEGHRRSMAITTGAKRRVFVTNRGRDWSEATPIPETSHGHIPIETNMRQGEKVMKRKPVFQARLLKERFVSFDDTLTLYSRVSFRGFLNS